MRQTSTKRMEAAAEEGEEEKEEEEEEVVEEEEEEVEGAEEEGEKEEEGHQRDQHAQVPGASFERRVEAGVEALAPPRRARPPPGSYADNTAVELDTDEEEEEEEEEEDEEEEEEGEGEVEDEDEDEDEDEEEEEENSDDGEYGGNLKRKRSGGGGGKQATRAKKKPANASATTTASRSEYQGVSRKRSKWRAQLLLNGKHMSLVTFVLEEVAARACDRMLVCCDLHGAKRQGGLKWLNFPYVDYVGELDELRGITQDELALKLRRSAEDTRTPTPTGTSTYWGVRRHGSKWRAKLKLNGKDAHLGYFVIKEEAARAVDRMRVCCDLHGERRQGGPRELNLAYAGCADELQELGSMTPEELVLKLRREAEDTRTPTATGASKYWGVSRQGSKWLASLRLNSKSTRLGTFVIEEEAARAVDRMRVCCDLHAVESRGAGFKGLNFAYDDYAGQLAELGSMTPKGLVETLMWEAKLARLEAEVAASNARGGGGAGTGGKGGMMSIDVHVMSGDHTQCGICFDPFTADG